MITSGVGVAVKERGGGVTKKKKQTGKWTLHSLTELEIAFKNVCLKKVN